MTRGETTAIYARISRDRSGNLLGVERQEKACRELAEVKGWAIDGLYVDDDQSAYSGKPRPEYLRLMEDVRGGTVGRIVALHPDRLHRSPLELEHFIDAVNTAGTEVVTVNAGHYDLTTRSGRSSARIHGVMARDESEAKSERLKLKHRELADKGRWRGGPRPYGYDVNRGPDGTPVKDGTLVIVPVEADAIREATRRVLAGETLHAIARDFNARGVPSVKPGTWWLGATLRKILLGETIRGERKGVTAVWEPIIDEATAAKLTAVLKDSSRPRQSPPPRTHLLTGGIARCARCGHALSGQVRYEKDKTKVRARLLVCLPHLGGCSLYVAAQPVEDIVTAEVLEMVDGPELAAALAGGPDQDDDFATELALIETKLDELADMLSTGELDRRGYVRAKGPWEERRDALRRRQAKDTRTAALAPYAGQAGALRAAWPTLTLDQRRAVVSAVVDEVRIAPATRRGRIFDTNRVTVVWRV
jgi:DNA invertase Pin-like site-specific DNA recombinase